jgi:hypothetical protein
VKSIKFMCYLVFSRVSLIHGWPTSRGATFFYEIGGSLLICFHFINNKSSEK